MCQSPAPRSTDHSPSLYGCPALGFCLSVLPALCTLTLTIPARSRALSHCTRHQTLLHHVLPSLLYCLAPPVPPARLREGNENEGSLEFRVTCGMCSRGRGGSCSLGPVSLCLVLGQPKRAFGLFLLSMPCCRWRPNARLCRPKLAPYLDQLGHIDTTSLSPARQLALGESRYTSA